MALPRDKTSGAQLQLKDRTYSAIHIWQGKQMAQKVNSGCFQVVSSWAISYLSFYLSFKKCYTMNIITFIIRKTNHIS